MKIQTVAVVGSGIMGRQIAMQVALSGYDVLCYDFSEEALGAAKDFSVTWFEKAVSKEKMTNEESETIQQRLVFTNDLEEVRMRNVDLVIEAVADILEVKRAVLAEVDAVTSDHTIFASNSSYLVSSEFADAVKHPDKVMNMHFFNPALIMKLVEIVRGPHVSDETFETIHEFVLSIDKIPAVINKEIYGFVVNRIFSAITKEACYLYDQGVASIEDIDTAVKHGLSHPMGPFELLDLTGIDLEYNVLMERFKATGNPADKPSPALVERYAKNQYGRKTKKGFYDYE